MINITEKNDFDGFVLSFVKNIKPTDMVLLFGDMGVGKTHFVRSVIKLILKNEKIIITSPSFPVINSYDGITHCDLFRIKTINELYQKGFQENIGKDIYFIEWPELILDTLKNYISLKFIRKTDTNKNNDLFFVEYL
jgi:tRNA threonylcarbamoyladenosine biosynthesis protein TsaE